MRAEFWHERWRLGQTGFHKAAVGDYLQTHWPQIHPSGDGRVLVPLCGKSVDLLWLRDRGLNVIGVELSSVAIEAFLLEHGILARRRTLPHFEAFSARSLELLRGDFFEFDPALHGSVSAVYDRASLISWAPELRDQYVEHLSSLTTSGTQTLLITVEYRQQQMQGPPFSVPEAEVERLYASRHTIERLETRAILDTEPRFRERGLTDLQEVCYRLTRR